MGMSMKDNGNKIGERVTALLCIRVGIAIRGIGWMIKFRGLECLGFRMGILMREIGSTIR